MSPRPVPLEEVHVTWLPCHQASYHRLVRTHVTLCVTFVCVVCVLSNIKHVLVPQLQEGVGKMKAAGPDAFKEFSTPVPTSKPVRECEGVMWVWPSAVAPLSDEEATRGSPVTKGQ